VRPISTPVDVHRETASEPARDLTAPYPPELTELVEREARISSIAVEVAGLQEELARLRGQSEAVERSLDERQAELAEKEISLARLADECARAQEGRVEAQASLVDAEKLLEGSRARVVTLEGELELLRFRITELEELEVSSSSFSPEPASPPFHFRFVPQSSGYTLSESAEPPPGVGELVELDGSRFSVARLGRSPFPHDARPCAFLVSEPDHVPES
jgi:hypothetical protein